MNREMVIVLDFGGQYNQLVARRVRECNVYCEIYSYKTDIEKILSLIHISLTAPPCLGADKIFSSTATGKHPSKPFWSS